MATRLRRRRPRTVRCKRCRARIEVGRKGRVPSYCGHTCRQLAYVQRGVGGPALLLAQDMATVRFRDFIRREIWNILLQAGLVGGDDPPPPNKPKSNKPTLRLVD